MWEFVSGLLEDPERLRAGLDAMIEEEREGVRGDLGEEVEIWLDKLAEADVMRAGYQELAAKGLMTLDELGERLAQVKEERVIARNELEALKRLEALERDREALLKHYAGEIPTALDNISPEERHRIYRMLRLKVTTKPPGEGLEVTGILCDSSSSLESETEFLH